MRDVLFKKLIAPGKGYEEEFINEGCFHAWGSCFEDDGLTLVQYSIAIIEDKQGFVHEIKPSNVKFVVEPQDHNFEPPW
ncbi:hypothetical protein SAMN04515674_105293 [Pseudarcicella hirudinis]|uniref:Uncharacterized protein n=1 Tax=Pseudarcicella hirudinis TaxID=1079859 RepID=A0A1I5SZD4_9BACT|nr:hypothetical protein [Pseudarcicella hirudinis]SFP76132.1 hypothetical protein SAMN04515674_105293 [Pseudarcicella hirudinis]